VRFSTYAAQTVNGLIEYHWERRWLDPSALRPGRNTLAVEVHQSSRASSDLSFDLRLIRFRWKEKFH
jgi:hypothetical protein